MKIPPFIPLTFSALLLAAVLAGCSTEPTPIDDPPPSQPHFQPVSLEGKNFPAGGEIFVAAYSHLYGPSRLDLTITLTIRNPNFKNPVIINSVRCYDHKGKIVHEYLPESHALEAMGSAEFTVRPDNTGGESALNFVIAWKAEKEGNTPGVEAVMVGKEGTHGFAFVNQGKPLRHGSE